MLKQIGFGVICVPLIKAAAILEKRCGTKICDRINEYCSAFHNQCEDCSIICNELSHNYDQHVCNGECQDYLQEIRYKTTLNYAADIERLEKKILILYILFLLLTIVILIIYGVQFVRFLRRHDYLSSKTFKLKSKKAQQSTSEYTHENPHTQSPQLHKKNAISSTNKINNNYNNNNNNNNNDKASEIFSITATECPSVKTVSTPISQRCPAEDTTLDFAYDNGGLQISPVTEKPKTETTF